jgi:hypothetical protein
VTQPELELFRVDPAEPEPKLSADRRRTLRQHAQVAAGVHPLMGGQPFPELGTCGTCRHRDLYRGGARSWPKCDLRGITHGPGTDCRASWPACSRYEAKP